MQRILFWISCLFFTGQAFASPLLTDFLFEDWKDNGKEWGTTALFDNDHTGGVSDICGKVDEFYFGRAYAGHHGWDRNIPNDHKSYVIFAAAPGFVTNVVTDCVTGDKWCGNGTGNRVVIDHGNGVVTKYFHGDHGNILVYPGNWVDRYTALFVGDSTGMSTGAHAHFQVEINGVAIDPLGDQVSWKNPPVIDKTNCPSGKDPVHSLVTPFTLRDYAIGKIVELNTQVVDAGYPEKQNLQWYLSSGGAHPADLIAQWYGNDTQNAVVLFDLLGNAPQAILLPPSMNQKWFDKGGPEGELGKPITPLYWYQDSTQRMDFQGGYMTYSPFAGGQVKDLQYTQTCPGCYENSWQAGKSYAFVTCYLNHGGAKSFEIFKPVKNWDGSDVQEVNTEKGKAAIILTNSDDNFVAYYVPMSIWSVYSTTGGPQKYGAPVGDAHVDSVTGKVSQDFEKGLTIQEEDASPPPPPVVTPPPETPQCIPSSEVCDGVDNDCDGQMDEDQGMTQCGFGWCDHKQANCINGKWFECNPYLDAQPEVCDGQDNDCDGMIDNGNVCNAPPPSPPPQDPDDPPAKTCSSYFKYSTESSCGSVLCLSIKNCDQYQCTAIISKAKGDTFSPNPTEWQLVDTLSNKVVATPSGFGCDSYYQNLTSFSVEFNPPDANLSLRLDMWSGGEKPCQTFYQTGQVALQKCE